MKKILTIIIASFALLSCDETIKPTSNIDNFDVTVLNTTVGVGQEVVFSFSGDPDIIYFYSDEMFHQYEYKDGRVVRVLETELSFDTQTPALSNRQTDQFSVLISTNYTDTGNEYGDIDVADWLDISDQFEFSTSNTYVNSGIVDISEYIEDGAPFHVGFRYINDTEDGRRPGRCNVQNFSLVAVMETGSIILGTMAQSGLKVVEQYPEYPSASTISSIRINLYGTSYTGINPIETWVISMPFVSGSIDYGPDRPIAVKGLSSDLDDFTYIYDEPGVYNVKFFAKNATIDIEEVVVREFTITVTDSNNEAPED